MSANQVNKDKMNPSTNKKSEEVTEKRIPTPIPTPTPTTLVVEYTGGRDVFMELLKRNPGVFIFKFGAEWCNPCKKIKNFVDRVSLVLPKNTMYIFSVDVDECFDLFAYLKQKKMVSGIPAILAYKMGNESYAPDASVSGTDETDLKYFFDTCLKMVA
jgi:thiol-disulfide isomerase/thioredoxin